MSLNFIVAQGTVSFMILKMIADRYLWILVAILLVNIFQRKYVPLSNYKRRATLIIAILALLWQILIVIIIEQNLPHSLAIVALLVPIGVAFLLKNYLFIFKRRCPSCNAKLNYKEILYYDDNICLKCRGGEEEAEVEEVKEISPSEATDVNQIDWDEWDPAEVAVLCYIFDGDNVLLIDKKTGFGKGKVSAPGGHIEEGETATEAAIREVKEEVGLDVSSLTNMGTLEFQFADGLSMRGYVFFTTEFSGELIETVEARPYWVAVKDLPYDKMWADDIHWLPMALDGKKFLGRFIFDGDDMLSYSLEEEK